MVEINPEDRRDVCAALQTMASISSSYKVESTKDIIQLWHDIRSNIQIKDDIDYVAVILSLGRIVDLQSDQINVTELQALVNSFRGKMEEVGITQPTLTDQGAAYLTMSCISHSTEVESTSSVLTLWDELRSQVSIRDNLDLASAVLATGRIMDLRADVKSPDALTEIVQSIRADMETQQFGEVDYRELSLLLLSAAIVELSPKVEKYRDIVNSWVDLRAMVSVSSIRDIVAIILFAGKIRDLDISMFMQPSSITEQINMIRTALDNMLG